MTSASTPIDEQEPEEAVKAKRRLWDIQPSRVDAVDAAANKEVWLIVKSEGAMSDIRSEENVMDVLTSIKKELMELKQGQSQPAEAAVAVADDVSVQPEAEPAPVPVSLEKAQGPVIREVAERAASLAAAMDEMGPDAQKLNEEVNALVALLQGILEKYPQPTSGENYPEPTDKYPAPIAKEECMGAAAIREVAEKAMSFANALDSEQPPSQEELVAFVSWCMECLKATAEKYPEVQSEPVVDACASQDEEKDKMKKEAGAHLQKAAEALYGISAELSGGCELPACIEKISAVANDLQPVFELFAVEKSASGSSEFETDEQRKEWANSQLHIAIAKSGVLAHVIGSEVAQEQQLKDLGDLLTILSNLSVSVPSPVEKAQADIASAIQEMVLKAEGIESEAAKLQYAVQEDLDKLAQAKETLNALTAKYVTVEKAAAYDVTDLGAVFMANKFLDQLNAGLQRIGYVAKDAKEEPATIPATPAASSAFEERIAALDAKVDSLIERLTKTDVAKSVETVPGPAAAGLQSATAAVDEFPPCPGNYNDPAYRALLRARGF